MFLLATPTEQTLDFGEGSVRFRECTAREYRAALRDPRFRDAATGEIDVMAAEEDIVRSHLTGWSLVGADGVALPFTPDNVRFAIENATIHGLQRLKGAVMGSMREALASGKGSEPASNG